MEGKPDEDEVPTSSNSDAKGKGYYYSSGTVPTDDSTLEEKCQQKTFDPSCPTPKTPVIVPNREFDPNFSYVFR